MAGISGASESRCALTRPRILTFLSRQSGSDTLMLSMPSGMSPARMPVICVVPPRYGTMLKLVPAIMLSSPTLTCDVGVLIPIWNVPGLAFSCSTSSLMELTGMLMLPTSAEGTSAISETGTKSLNGS